MVLVGSNTVTLAHLFPDSITRFLLLMPALVLFAVFNIADDAEAQPKIRGEKILSVSKADSLFFIDHWVVRNSVVIHKKTTGEEIEPKDNWGFDYPSGNLRIIYHSWLEHDADSTHIRVQYKRYPFNIRPVYFNRELIRYTPAPDDTTAIDAEQLVRTRVTRDDIFGSSNLQRSGSLTRGITVGTNQDMTLQSGLRFELSGFITDDVEVLATLTDQSTPIQPDGTTQNLRELDKVYMRLNSPYGSLELGDIDVMLRSSEFAQIERRLQGIGVETAPTPYGTFSSSASVVRGRFRVQQFAGRNGLQGPYRLNGADGEQFIIVLAGTERVYLNGVRMTRGEDNDYIIDYSLGEIFFTSNRMITDISRITVDFQYVTQEYNRTLITAEGVTDELLGGRLEVGATFIREADSRDLNTEFGLTDEERQILREAGNDPDKAIISGAENVGFIRDADFILYAKADTTLNGQQFEIFRHVPGDSSGTWRVRFSRTGEGQGSYRRKNTSVNGIVFEWVGPGNGSYEPFRRIPAPQSQQMTAIRSRLNLTNELEMFGEWAVSDFDRNRFSDIDNEDNTDFAYLAGLRLRPVETLFGDFDFQLSHRNSGRNFAYFDRTRDVEFERNWNVPQAEQVREELTEAEAGLAFSNFSSIRLRSGLLNRTDIESFRQTARINTREPGFPILSHQVDYLNSTFRESGNESTWLRQIGETSYSFPVFGLTVNPGFAFESENRQLSPVSSDSLLTGSFEFYDIGPGLDIRIGSIVEAGAQISYRRDRRAASGDMLNEADSWTRTFRTTLTPSEAFTSKNSLIFRDKTFRDFFIENEQSENSRSVLVRSETDYRPSNDFFELSLFYEGGTESRPLLQETFVEVGPEQGNYVWIDLNNDGVQQIDEFFPAQTPNEGIYILQFIPTDELFAVASVNSRLRTRLNPAVLLEESEGTLPTVLRNIELTSVVEIREQNRSGDIADIMLFNLNRFQDEENTIDGRIYWLQDVRLFRPNRNYDLRFSIDRSKGMRRRASGLDRTLIRNIRTEGSVRLARRWLFQTEMFLGRNDASSEDLASRSFEIRSRGVKPSLRFDYTRSFQVTGGFSYAKREDTLPAEPAVVNSLTMFSEINWFSGSRLQTFGRIEYRSNRMRGISSSFGAFELTDGAGMGNTWMWSLQGNYRISEFLRASVNYDGRTVTDRPTIQTLRFTLNAVF